MPLSTILQLYHGDQF